jgi:recombinational DNA repair ATPase RecF
MKPQKHAKLIKLWADGAEIEYYRYATQVWTLMEAPNWSVDTEYRLKPKRVITETFIRQYKSVSDNNTHETFTNSGPHKHNLRMTWEDDTLIKAEVI